MARELTFDDYYKAAKLVANCRQDRIPYVLQILEQSEINIDEIETIIAEVKAENKKHIYCKRANENYRGNWKPSDNDTTLLLRKAYDLNISFSSINSITGIDRTSLYKYLWGERTPSEVKAKIIADKVGKMIEEVGGAI